MGSQQYRGELERKRKQRVDAEKKAGEYRNKESKKRAEAAKARQEAAKTSSATTANEAEPSQSARQGSCLRWERGEQMADEGIRICEAGS